MMRSLGQYTPPSFVPAQARDYQSFLGSVTDFLQNRQAQYQIQFLQGVIDVLNTGAQAFGLDLPATPTLNVTNWAHRILGAGTINTITPPNGFQSFIILLSLNGFTFGAGGNISNPVTVTAGHPALCVYDPTATGMEWWILTDSGGGGGGLGTVAVVTEPFSASPYMATLSSSQTTLYLVSASASSDFIFNLPPATGSGEVAIIKKEDPNAHNIAVTPNGTDTIDGVNAPVDITIQYDTLSIADATVGAWAVI